MTCPRAQPHAGRQARADTHDKTGADAGYSKESHPARFGDRLGHPVQGLVVAAVSEVADVENPQRCGFIRARRRRAAEARVDTGKGEG